MRAKDTIRLDTLRGLNALFLNEMLAQKAPTGGEYLSDDKVLALIKRSVKQRMDSIRQFEIGKRPDLAAKEKDELAILQTFLPQNATREEIATITKQHLSELLKQGVTVDSKSVGKLTGLVMKSMAGKADGNDVKAVVEDLTKNS